MSDLISRQKAIAKFKETCTFESRDKNGIKYGEIHTAITYDGIIKIIESLPSAEPERTAKVRDKKNDPMVDEWYHGRCMNCGKQVRRRDNYCSRCGARLEWK